MPDTTSPPSTPDPARVGEMLGSAVAGIVILHMRAASDGWERGYLHEHAVRYPATYGTPPPGCEVPEQYTHLDVHAQTYRDEFAKGRADYRADHGLPAHA